MELETKLIVEALAELRFEMKLLSKQFDILLAKYSETKMSPSYPTLLRGKDYGKIYIDKDMLKASLKEDSYAGDYENPEPIGEELEKELIEGDPEEEARYPKFYVKNGSYIPPEEVPPPVGAFGGESVSVNALWEIGTASGAEAIAKEENNRARPWEEPLPEPKQ